MRFPQPSEPTRRRLWIAFSTACFAASALVVVLWVPSYYWRAQLTGGIGTHHVFATSLDGRLRLAISRSGGWPYGTSLSAARLAKDDNGGWSQDPSPTLGFDAWISANWTRLGMPHWFLLLLTLAAGIAPWRKRPWRYGLRAALIALTAIAVTLGTAIYVARI